MEVEFGEAKRATKEGKVIEIIVFVESVGIISKLWICVFSFEKLIDEVKSRHTS